MTAKHPDRRVQRQELIHSLLKQTDPTITAKDM